jgi:hypothetical protein
VTPELVLKLESCVPGMLRTSLIICAFVAACHANTCTPIMEGGSLTTKVYKLGFAADDMHQAAMEYADFAHYPMVKAIMTKAKAFKDKFTNYELDASLFRLTPDLGLNYILMSFGYRGTGALGVHDMSTHCVWLGGKLFQPASLDIFLGVRDLFNSVDGVKYSDFIIPVYKKDSEVLFYPSGNDASWITGVGQVPEDKINTDSKIGLNAKVQELSFLPVLDAKFCNISLCTFRTRPSVLRIPDFSRRILRAAAPLPDLMNALTTLTTALSEIPRPSNPCDHLKFTFPHENRQDLLTFVSRGKPNYFTIQTENDLQQQIAKIEAMKMALRRMTALASEIHAQFNVTATQANNGDWSSLHFDIFEAEEQLILTLAGIICISISIHVFLLWKCFTAWRNRRLRRIILSKYPNIEQMPMLERSRLAK